MSRSRFVPARMRGALMRLRVAGKLTMFPVMQLDSPEPSECLMQLRKQAKQDKMRVNYYPRVAREINILPAFP